MMIANESSGKIHIGKPSLAIIVVLADRIVQSGQFFSMLLCSLKIVWKWYSTISSSLLFDGKIIIVYLDRTYFVSLAYSLNFFG
jgi:hypothetical protein